MADTLDPTENVKELVQAQLERLQSEIELRADYERRIADQSAAHGRELREAEAKRIDAILDGQATALTVASRESTAAADTLATQLTQLTAAINARLSSIEGVQSANVGRGLGASQLWGFLIGAVGVGAALVAIVVNLGGT